jgi:branched-chain amino acid transport system ATP-binding protein
MHMAETIPKSRGRFKSVLAGLQALSDVGIHRTWSGFYGPIGPNGAWAKPSFFQCADGFVHARQQPLSWQANYKPTAVHEVAGAGIARHLSRNNTG